MWHTTALLDALMLAEGESSGHCPANVPHSLDCTHAYVSGSLWSGFGQGRGEFSDGPYGIQDPTAFFKPAFYPWPFNPEVAPVPSKYLGFRVKVTYTLEPL